MPQLEPNAIQRLRVRGTEAQVAELLHRLPIEARRVIADDGRVMMDIAVERHALSTIEKIGLTVLRAIDTADPRRSRRVGAGNRFESGAIPEGLGRLRREV